jgi:hypothetical protein
MAQNQGNSTSTQSAGTSGGAKSMGAGAQGATGIQDATYNVISVVYHALQGAETIQKYLKDVQNDPQCEQFFREAQEQNKRLAQRGRELLAQVLQQGGQHAHGQHLQGGSASGQQGSSGQQPRGSGQQSQGGSGQQSQSGSSSGQMGASGSSRSNR